MTRMRFAWFLLFAGLTACAEPSLPEVTVREIQGELLFAQERWSVVDARTDAAPFRDRIVPSTQLAKAKEDWPSLIMPPPCEVRLPLTPGAAPAYLRAFAGIDRSAARHLAVGEFAQVRLEVWLDERLAWSDELRLEGKSGVGAGWVSISPELEGLSLGEAKLLTLRTSLVAGSEPKEPLKVGFGRLLVEEHHRMTPERSSVDAPNVVFVVMDTLRFDRTSSGAYSKETTPHLAALAERGVDWRAAFATAPWTWPSTASMLTGLLPEEHGVTGSGASYLASELDTLAEVLQRAGLVTAAFVGNPLIVPAQNFDQGFQHFEGTEAGVFVDGVDLVPRALDWVRQQGEARFFLYLHLVDPHVPYDPAPEVGARFGGRDPKGWGPDTLSVYASRMMRGEAFDVEGRPTFREWIPRAHRERMQSAYDEAVWTGDLWFGRVLQALAELGLDEKTVVVFTSDHGEELLDHGLLKHSHSLYQELVRVPLVIAGPGFPRGEVVRSPVSNRRVFDTLRELVARSSDGARASLLSPGEPGEPIFFSTVMAFWNGVNHLEAYGVHLDDWTLHFAPRGGPFGVSEEDRLETNSLEGRVRLFFTPDDPAEQHDLAAEHPDKVHELLGRIRQRLVESKARAVRGTLASGAGTRDMLQAIGYLEGE